MNVNSNHTLRIESLDYHAQSTLALFERVAQQPWAMLLRSASESHINSRYDILVADPVVTIETQGETSNVTLPNGMTECVSEDPFSLLARLKSAWLPSLPPIDDLPFQGGAVGYFSYDLGRQVETLPEIAEQDIDAPDMAVGLYDWAIIADHQTQSLTLVNLRPDIDRLDWLNSQATPTARPFSLTSTWRANMSQKTYTDKFNAVKEFIKAGDCYQINLAQRFCADYQGDEWQAYRRLETANQAPFSAFIRLDKHAILSVSPERFLELKDNLVETKPIKGTRPRHADPVLDAQEKALLGTTDKDKAENLMIVDLLRNDIGRVAKPGTVKVPKLFDIESFPAVHHLVSTVTAQLDERFGPEDLLRAGFPGGSITGAPKVRAMEIIEELEPQRRSIYCGSIGYISCCGRMDTSITIRTLINQEKTLYAWAGGGLVFDSEASSEYQETLDKLSRILPVLD